MSYIVQAYVVSHSEIHNRCLFKEMRHGNESSSVSGRELQNGLADEVQAAASYD